MEMKTVDFQGIKIEVPNQAADAIVAMRRSHDEEIEQKDMAEKELRDKIKDLEEKLAKAEAKGEDSAKRLADAEAKLTPEAIDASVRERQKVIDDAHKLAPKLDCSTLDTAAIKRAALEAIDVDLDGKSADFLDAAFEARVEVAGNSPLQRTADAFVGAAKNKVNDAPKDPRAEYMARQSVAYRGGQS